MALALDAGVSPRHLCFVENGRSQPSRALVLALSRALRLPLRESNDLLEAAGFAREFRESALDALELAPVRHALDLLLAHQEPFPAIVIDRHWNLKRANGGAQRLFAWLGQGVERPDESNMLRALFDGRALRPRVVEWERVAASLVQRVRNEALCGILDEASRALLSEIGSYPGVPRDLGRALDGPAPGPLVPVTFARDGVRLSFFSALTTLGTPRDVTLQELRLEHFFPADEATEQAMRRPKLE
jgi:hypothetical protein